jgi:Putative Flp pilus-assembly TadE/G-like
MGQSNGSISAIVTPNSNKPMRRLRNFPGLWSLLCSSQAEFVSGTLTHLPWVDCSRTETATMPKATGKHRAREAGQALIIVALAIVVLLAAAGLAVDMGYLRYQRRLLQSAADSAAIAGAAAAGTGGSVSAAAQDDLQLNGYQDGVKGFKFTPPTQFTLNGNANTVKVQVAATVPTFFMKIFGPATSQATISATATGQYTSARDCMFALQGGGGINIGNGANINVPHCGVASAEGLSVNGTLRAASIGVHDPGAVNRATPPPVFGIPQPPDPLANLPLPPGINPCVCDIVLPRMDPKTKKPLPVTPAKPGNYRLISIGPGQIDPVTFNPGTYILADPAGTNKGGLWLQGPGKIIGSGVTFYLQNGTIQLGSNQQVQLSAPTGGTYAGILFFQDRGDTAPETLAWSNNWSLQGGFYFPRASLTINGPGSPAAAYMLFVAKTLNLNANISFLSNYSSLVSSPIKSAVLVQ